MSPQEYLLLCFFWVCFVSVDTALRRDFTFRTSGYRRWISNILGIFNISILQLMLPVLGFAYLFPNLPTGDRQLILVCIFVIVCASLLVHLGCWLGFRGKPLKAEIFLLLMLVVGSIGWGGGFIFFNRKYNMIGNSVLVPFIVSIVNLYYGAFRYITILINISKLCRRGMNPQVNQPH